MSVEAVFFLFIMTYIFASLNTKKLSLNTITEKNINMLLIDKNNLNGKKIHGTHLRKKITLQNSFLWENFSQRFHSKVK